jgi:hypothetical protein
MTLEERKNYDEALKMACVFEAWMGMQGGFSPTHLAGAAVMLAGKIVGSAADDEAHVQRGLAHLIKIMNLTASDFLAAQQRKH